MVALPGDILISNCHRSIIYLGDEGKYLCGRCMRQCNSAGTLSDLWREDKSADPRQKDEDEGSSSL